MLKCVYSCNVKFVQYEKLCISQVIICKTMFNNDMFRYHLCNNVEQHDDIQCVFKLCIANYLYNTVEQNTTCSQLCIQSQNVQNYMFKNRNYLYNNVEQNHSLFNNCVFNVYIVHNYSNAKLFVQQCSTMLNHVQNHTNRTLLAAYCSIIAPINKSTYFSI